MSIQIDIVHQVLEVQIVNDQVLSVAIWDGFTFYKNGVRVGAFRSINFKEGANTTIAVTESGRTADVEISSTGGGGGAAIQFQDEGVNLGNNQADTVDFVGPGVTATRALDKITVTIPGGGGGGPNVLRDWTQGSDTSQPGAFNVNNSNPDLVTQITFNRYDEDNRDLFYFFGALSTYFNNGGPVTIHAVDANDATKFWILEASAIVGGGGIGTEHFTLTVSPLAGTGTYIGRTFSWLFNYSYGTGGVQSVTGDGVDNADPANPVLSWPTPGDIGAYPDSNPDNYVDAAGAAAAAPVQSVTGTQVGGTSSNPVINLPPDASPTVKGITKLYSTIGNNIDGAVDQNTVKEYVDSKLVTGSDIFLNLNFY